MGEWHHPVRSALVPTISIGLLLLAILALNAGAGTLALWLWGAGALGHLALTLAIVGRWLNRTDLEPAHANPAWFIPAVGNVLVPLAGVRLGYEAVSWLFFGIGMGFWLVLLPIVFGRLFFAAPLPERMRPLLFILIPPPAIGFLSYVLLTGTLDAPAHVLYGFGAFLTGLHVPAGGDHGGHAGDGRAHRRAAVSRRRCRAAGAGHRGHRLGGAAHRARLRARRIPVSRVAAPAAALRGRAGAA